MGERTAAEEDINQTGTRRYRGIQNRRRIALASRRWKEDLRAADYFPIIYLGTSGEDRGSGGGIRRVVVFRRRRWRRRRWWMQEEGNGGRMPTAAGESGRARTTDTIAAINTGEQPLTSPTGGPILYFISKLIPREQIYCKKGVKKYIFSAHGPPARSPRSLRLLPSFPSSPLSPYGSPAIPFT